MSSCYSAVTASAPCVCSTFSPGKWLPGTRQSRAAHTSRRVHGTVRLGWARCRYEEARKDLGDLHRRALKSRRSIRQTMRSTPRSSRRSRSRSRASTRFFPWDAVGTSLQVAMVDPSNYRALDDLKFITGFNIEPLQGRRSRHPGGHRIRLQRSRSRTPTETRT